MDLEELANLEARYHLLPVSQVSWAS